MTTISTKKPVTVGRIISWVIIALALLALIGIALPVGKDGDSLLNNTYKTVICRILIFSVYAMAYDILRGFTGFIHLGFALFLGGGSYFTGILLKEFGVSWPVLLLAIVGTTVYSVLWGLLVGRISASGGSLLATAMITMAFGEIMRSVMEKWRTVTNGLDGFNFKLPDPLMDRTFVYYLCMVFLLGMGFVLYKFINSPTGRVLQGVRENEQRAIFLGYNTSRARTIALLVAGIVAGLAGVMSGILNRAVNTDVLSMQQTYNAMLYSLIGGTGTLFGAIAGSTVVIFFQNILLNLRNVAGVGFIFERWLLFFGALYIVVIMFMPQGIMGFYYSWKEKREHKKRLAALGSRGGTGSL